MQFILQLFILLLFMLNVKCGDNQVRVISSLIAAITCECFRVIYRSRLFHI